MRKRGTPYGNILVCEISDGFRVEEVRNGNIWAVVEADTLAQADRVSRQLAIFARMDFLKGE